VRKEPSLVKGNGLIKIVGDENILESPETMEEYSRDMSFVHPIRPQCVVKPKDAGEVQKLVKWANETLTPLVPVSSGAPHFHGDTVPSAGGAIIVDLSRMKKIVRIDARNRIALIEPGVTFEEIIPQLEKEGLKLNMPLLPRRSKSVAASLLEREPVIMPKYHWDGSDPLACTEVIYGTGDKFKTGSAAGSGDLEYQWESGAAQVAAGGPAQADFHRLIQGSQGTMGIVTWVSVRCERLPSLEEPFLISSSELDGLIEINHWLLRRRLVDECLILNSTNLAEMLARQWPEEFESIRDRLPAWVLFYCIAGYDYFPEEKIAYQQEDIADITAKLGLKPVKSLASTSASDLLSTLRKPSEEPYWKLRGKGSCYDVFFITNSDKLPELIDVMNDVAGQHGYPLADMGVYIQPVVQGTSYHCEFNLFFNPDNPSEVDRVRRLSTTAPEILATRGAFFSRPYGPWADLVYRREAETAAALRKIKAIFDPQNVLNPGKLCF
jgi:FAD/FMN-containing dehydrogenase